ncbi:TPA: hypothetical protein DD394_01420 [bacterium UBP9_UBA11836]|nr:hypothetical protein [bacterium UBP9_UBA11836]
MIQSGKLALAFLWSAGLWLLVFVFLFLFLPVLSALPLSWGAFCALLAFSLQFIGGIKVLRLLLGVKEAEADAIFFIPGTCPFVFLLDGQLVATEATRPILAENNHLELVLRNSWNKSYSWVYSNLLAFPALLRAFESFTSDYGRLHFSQGPLWHLGRIFGWLAARLESPLRWGQPPLKLVEPSDAEFIRKALLTPLGRAVRVPAWMADLDIISVVDFAEAKREAAWFWAGREGLPPAPPRPFIGLWFPWLLFLVMVLWAVFAQGLWGAPILFLGLGYIVKINSEYASGRPLSWKQVDTYEQKCKYVPISISGVARRQDTPGLDDTWLDFSEENKKMVRLESFVGWQAAEGASIKCIGWLNGCTLALCVSKLSVGAKSYNYYPRLWRLLLPWFLFGAGLLWSILQKVGL